jgi:hypothetical protein
MNSKCYWSILDREGRAIESWVKGFFFVACYEKYSQAKQDALRFKLLDYKICMAEEALKRKPSKLISV